jgi:hypothetical protein
MTLYSGHLAEIRRGKTVVHAPVGFGIVTDPVPVYGAPVSVSCFIDNTDDYDLYYSTDGTDPSGTSDKYTEPVRIYRSCRFAVRAIEKSTGWMTYAVTADFTLSVPVSFDAESGDYFDPFYLTITAPDDAYDIFYVTDGGEPSVSSLEYSGPVLVTGTWTVNAAAFYDGVICGPVCGGLLFSRFAHLLKRIGILFGAVDLIPMDVWMRFPWGKLAAADALTLFEWAMTDGVDSQAGVSWGRVGVADVDVLASFARVLSVDDRTGSQWNRVDEADRMNGIPWGKVSGKDTGGTVPWNATETADRADRIVWGLLKCLEYAVHLKWGALTPVDERYQIPWTKMRAIDRTSFSAFVPGNEKQRERLVSALRRVPWISAARFIMTQQNITFKRVADNEPVRIISGSFGIDENSWDYQFAGVIPSREDLDKVKPDALGAGTGKVLVELSINGYAARFLVDAYSENRQWAKGTYSISGRSPACVLGPGYAPLETRVYTSTTAQQIVANTLSGTGFSYQWGLVTNTWTVNGEYSVCDKTKIEIISEIAKAVGGIVQVNPLGDTLHLKKRHPVSPKNYGAVTPDEIILSGVLTQGGSYQTSQKYNAVVVRGKETGCYLTVVRENTPGDRIAPEIIDPLLTAQALNIERGRAFLDATGYDTQAMTLELPLPPSGSGQRPKMLFPCDLVEVFDGVETWRGRVTSAEVGFEPARTRQRVGIERCYVQ